MHSTCSVSISRAGALCFLAAALLPLGSCSALTLGDAPFLCSPQSPDCPAGYHCDSRLCVREGLRAPIPLGTSVADDVSAFSLRPVPSTGNLTVCWRQSLGSRDPGIHAAVLTPAGDVHTPETTLYSGDSDSIAVLSDISGDCAIENNQTIVAATRLAGTEQYLTRVFAVDVDSGMSRNTANEGFHRHGFNYYSVGTVGDETWIVDSRNLTAGNDLRGFYLSRITAQFTLMTQLLMLPVILADREFINVDTLGGTGGAWVSPMFRDSTAEFGWLSTALDTHSFVAQPVANYQGAFMLAVRGTQLAVAYHLDGDTWQIYWISPAPDDPGDPAHSGSVATPGPSITLASGVLRPGGTADGDRLVFAGATDSEHVDLWETTWGSAEAFRPLERVTKLSHVVPRRLRVTSTGGRLIAVWTERVPASNNGFAEYVSLTASALETRPRGP